MATRKDIRQAFYNHLEIASSGLVPADNISEEEPDSDENLPAIVHGDDYRKIPLNMGSGGPTHIVYDQYGDATEEVYHSVREASFGVVPLDTDESRREDIYEAVCSYFEKYEEPAWDASDIHSDVKWVRVLDANSTDQTNSTPLVRGDRLIIRLTFVRDHRKAVDAVDQMNLSVDVEDDGTVEETYTFTS